MTIPDTNTLKNIILTSEAAAAILAYDKRYLSECVTDHGMPKLDYNQYSLFDIVIWKYARLESLHKKELDAARSADTKGRLDTVNAEIKELELAEKRKQLIPVDRFIEAMENEAAIYVRGLEVLQTKLKTILNLPAEQTDLIEKEINSIRTQLGKLPADISADALELT
jgi:hypothetical protein